MRHILTAAAVIGAAVAAAPRVLKGTIVGRWLGITEPEPSPENVDPPTSGSRTRAGSRTVNLYVILLRDEVWRRRRKFREQNPNRQDNMPCVYVGQTSRTPEERFEQHMAGGKLSSPIVRKYGVRLLPDLYKDRRPVPAAEREEREDRLARDLQRRGYGVWWN